MKKNTKKILTLSVLGMFMLMFAMSFVAAADNPIVDWFADWEDSNLSTNIVKYLFWALVSMVVYSISSQIPGLNSMFTSGKEWLGGLFSILIGFLAMAYITPEEVYAMMISYSALGFVIGGALPFLILIAFTFTLATNTTGGAKQQLANKSVAWVMWAAFVGFMIYRIIITVGSSDVDITSSYKMLQWIVTIVSIAILLALGTIWKKFGQMEIKVSAEEYRKKTEKQTAKLKADVEALQEVTKAP